MVSFFHSYDLRGKFPDEIGEEEAEKVGKAYGTFTDAEEVLIGRDGRTHGEKICQAFIDGVSSTGTSVAYAGMIPSPIVYFGQVDNGFDSAAVVTASHNPPEYTGFKFNLEGALAMSREGGMKDIEDIYLSEEFESGDGEVRDISVVEDYLDAVEEKIGHLGLDVLVNCGNGVTGVVAEELFERLACNTEVINGEVDGNFPDHLADPGNEEAKERTLGAMEGHDLGVIFDGDGDRAGFVVPGYGFVGEDHVNAVFASESLKRKKGKVVYDLRASKLVPEKIREEGGTPEESRVGHTFISERIHQDQSIVYAGELSGHYYFPAYRFPWDDGLFAAALMCSIASEGNLAERLESYPEYPVSPEISLDCPEEAKEKVIEMFADDYPEEKVSRKDGVKVHFESGWVLVRPSSTEEKVRIRCEADSEEEVDEFVEEAESKVRKLIRQAQ